MTDIRIFFTPNAGDGLAAPDCSRSVELTDYFVAGTAFIGPEEYDDHQGGPVESSWQAVTDYVWPPRPTISVAVAREQFESRGAFAKERPIAGLRPRTVVSIPLVTAPAAVQEFVELLAGPRG